MTPLVVIGGSAGAFSVLRQLLTLLDRGLPLAYAVVLHRQAVEEDQRLERLLGMRSALRVIKVQGGEVPEAGVVAVCPASVHLEIRNGRYHLSNAPKENRMRPSVDVLFRSAAEYYGPQCASIVLSGVLDDGSLGTAAIRNRGGFTIAQDPAEADYGDMPRNAIAAGTEHVAPLNDIPALLETFNRNNAQARAPERAPVEHEELTNITCPDCGGVLWHRETEGVVQYKCRVGHAFAPKWLEAIKSEMVEDALWAAAQVLEEQADLGERASKRATSSGKPELAMRLSRRSEQTHRRAEIVKAAIANIRELMVDSEVLAEEG